MCRDLEHNIQQGTKRNVRGKDRKKEYNYNRSKGVQERSDCHTDKKHAYRF